MPFPLQPDVELEPVAASALFGARIDVARSYAELLARAGEPLGLLGPSEPPRLWSRHVLNSVLLAPLLGGEVADVGSGAGLPGIPLAIARPDVSFTLVEPMERRADWLASCVRELDLSNVTVRRARAEDLHDELLVDQVTARAVAGFGKLIPLVVPLLRHGGELLLLKGRGAEAEIEAATKQVRRHGLLAVRVEELEHEGVESTRVLRAEVE